MYPAFPLTHIYILDLFLFLFPTLIYNAHYTGYNDGIVYLQYAKCTICDSATEKERVLKMY